MILFIMKEKFCLIINLFLSLVFMKQQMEQFGQGQPIRHLIRCQGSPNIYAQENGLKRSIQEPLPATQARLWDKVHRVSCDYLRRLPDGLPIEPQPQSSETE